MPLIIDFDLILIFLFCWFGSVDFVSCVCLEFVMNIYVIWFFVIFFCHWEMVGALKTHEGSSDQRTHEGSSDT